MDIVHSEAVRTETERTVRLCTNGVPMVGVHAPPVRILRTVFPFFPVAEVAWGGIGERVEGEAGEGGGGGGRERVVEGRKAVGWDGWGGRVGEARIGVGGGRH